MQMRVQVQVQGRKGPFAPTLFVGRRAYRVWVYGYGSASARSAIKTKEQRAPSSSYAYALTPRISISDVGCAIGMAIVDAPMALISSLVTHSHFNHNHYTYIFHLSQLPARGPMGCGAVALDGKY
eukprot:scaffold240573_cov50-Tisochrysis_lutea.AAC.1